METVTRAINSSSKLKQRWLCPGSAWAERRATKLLDDENSKEGTLLHWKDAHPEESRDDLTIGQIEVLETNKTLRDRYLENELIKLNIPATAIRREFVEMEFFLCDESGMPIESHGEPVPGHPDLIIYFPDYGVAIIFDSKFGRKEVPAAWINLQLRSYAVMFYDNFGCDRIVVGITQPFAKAANNFHCAQYSSHEIPMFRQELIDIIRATEPEDAQRHPSVDACTYCDALGECPVSIDVATSIIKLPIESLTIEELEALAPDMELSKKVIDKWKDRMTNIARSSPEKLKQHKMGKDQQTREITSAAAAFRELLSVDLIPVIENPTMLTTLLESDMPTSTIIGSLENFMNQFCKASAPEIEGFIAKAKKMKKDQAKTRLHTALGGIIQFGVKSGSLEKISVNVHEGKESAE